jgi:nicotinate-nucleotide adenylyltransferase
MLYLQEMILMKKNLRFGIFGGSFNPPHLGHLQSAQSVMVKAGLDLMFFVPNHQNPLKSSIDGPSASERLTMTELAVKSWSSKFVVDDLEIRRQGKSYTVDTVREFKNKYPEAEIYLVIGVDAFNTFHQWKNPEQILNDCSVIVTSRAGNTFPPEKESWPEFLTEMIVEEDFNFLELKSGQSVQFVRIPDLAISSTEIRRKVRAKVSCDQELTLNVENHIKEAGYYLQVRDKIGDFAKFSEFCFQTLNSKKIIQPRAFDLKGTTAITDYAIVGSGSSSRHTTALAENLIRQVKQDYGVHPLSCEGLSEGRWVVVDYGGLVVHLFYDYVRQEYSIERLWSGSKELNFGS